MTRRILVTARATREIRRSFAWLLIERDRTYAEKWYVRIQTAIASLVFDADQWPEAAEAEWFGPGLRERLVGRKRQAYRILFSIQGEIVYVHTLRHISQDFLTPDDL